MTQLPQTSDKVRLELDRGVLRVWLNDPETRNALSDELLGGVEAALDAVREDRSVRAIVLRGSQGVFCAGGNIKGFRGSQEQPNREQIAAGNRTYGDFLLKMNAAPQVTVMAVEGGAIGGGLGLACVGDVTITTADTRFAMTETSLGIPPAQIALFVRERIGLTQCRRLMLAGARFRGEEAARLGIAHYCEADTAGLEERVEQVLLEITRCAPGANAVTKNILLQAGRLSPEETLDMASLGFADCMIGGEASEGVAAFLEKRKPSWAEIEG